MLRRVVRRLRPASGRAVRVAGEALARSPYRRGGLRVHRSRHWNDRIEGALREIGVDDPFGIDAHIVAGRDVAGVDKIHVVVTDRGDSPLAALSLRRRRGHWEPVAEQCLPDASIVARADAAATALAAVGLEIQIDLVAGDGPALGAIETWYNDAYCADISPDADYEAYWRTSSHWKNLRSARNRTEHLELRRDRIDDIDWVVRSWASNWVDDGGDAVRSTEDRIAVWQHLFERGAVQTIVLLDEGRPVAGAVNVAAGDRMTGQCLTRDRDYPVKSIGHRVIDEGFKAAREAGYRWFDLGGGVDYKRVWAPVREVRCVAVIQPRWRRLERALRGEGEIVAGTHMEPGSR